MVDGDSARTERVATNLTCNQNCRHCTARREVEERDFIRPAAVRARIDAALASGAGQLVLAGGEPMLRRDLALLVAHARQQGAEGVSLETNATLATPERALELARAGLTSVRAKLFGWGPELDSLTRDEGGFQTTLEGIRAFLGAGLEVEVLVALLRSTLPLLGGLPRGLAELGRLRVIAQVPSESTDPAQLVSYASAAPALEQLERDTRAVGLGFAFDPSARPPPCVFPRPARVAHLYSLTEGGAQRAGYRQVEACASCGVAARCPGFSSSYLEAQPLPELHPIAEDRTRRRLSLVGGVEDQVERELVMVNRRGRPGEPSVEERIIRVSFHCNQSCRFCFVSTHLPAAADARVERAIAEAGRAGARVTLSGGEPTLNPRLAHYVKLAKQVSAHPVELQTNAVLLGDAERVEELVGAGLDEVFVSLHGASAEVSDAITEAPGTFERTLRGLDQLSRSPLALILNFVICRGNFRQLEEYVELVASRWPKATVNISFVAASTDVVPKERELMPSYSEVLPSLQRALERAAELGLEVGGFASMCGLPLCLVPEPARGAVGSEIPEGFDAGEFVKPEVCQRCSLEPRCYGVRRHYVDLWGASELRAVAAPRSASAGGGSSG